MGLERLKPEDLTAEDLLWWIRGRAPSGGVPSESFEEFLSGKLILFRLSPGILAVRVNESRSGRELDVGDLAGQGVIHALPEIIESIKALARNLGCNRLVTRVHRRGLRRLYERAGAKVTAWELTYEL